MFALHVVVLLEVRDDHETHVHPNPAFNHGTKHSDTNPALTENSSKSAFDDGHGTTKASNTVLFDDKQILAEVKTLSGPRKAL